MSELARDLVVDDYNSGMCLLALLGITKMVPFQCFA